jgi:uncharacterized membrane protein
MTEYLGRNLWLVFAFATCLLWGGFLPQFTVANRVYGLRFLMVNGGGMFLIGFIASIFYRSPAPKDLHSVSCALIGGIASALGYLTLNFALVYAVKQGGKANIAYAVATTWVALGAVLNWHFLGESMPAYKWGGVLLAVAAAVILSL